LANAELLRRGLPLKNPVMRRGSPVARHHHQPSSVPPPPTTYTIHSGVIEVHNSANGNLLGYIGKNLGNGGAQFVYDPALSNALVVSFQTVQGGPATQTHLDISMQNSNPSWPLLGLVQGRDDTTSDLSSGSYQYLYLGGVDNPGTQPGDKPTSIDNSYFIGSPRTAETAVWTFFSSNNTLFPQWINTDGTSPVVQQWTQSTGLYSGGDQNAFFARFPAPVTSLYYIFVPQ